METLIKFVLGGIAVVVGVIVLASRRVELLAER